MRDHLRGVCWSHGWPWRQDDLTVRKVKGQDQYVPASTDDPVEVVAGGVYLHNRSGVRKASGSYFTKPFAVEHLLDHALEPALDDHMARLEGLRASDDDAARGGRLLRLPLR